MIYLYKKISPLKLNIAKLYFKRIKPEDKENNVLENNLPNNNECITEKIPISSNILFPPLKRNKKALIVASKRAYEGRNSDKNALKSKSKENLNKTEFKNSEKKASKFAPFNNNNNNNNNNKNIPLPNTEEKGNIYLKQGELDNFELNHLEYEEALILDKRNFCKIYWLILKREHLIIFTFFFHDDYNLYYVKFARFIFLLATDMAMNVFFFSDETMNKLYLSYGKYDFVQQIPQIIYAKIVSNILEVVLCFLSLTDKHYYQIKSLPETEKYNIFKIIKFAKVKLIIFFVFTFMVFLFYLYLVTAFCAVCENTQIVYIKDALFGFLLGYLEPFIIYFFPTLFRKIALNCKSGKCLYTLSDVIPIF